MIYLGKINGPCLPEILKREHDDFRKRKINYYVWEQGMYVGQCIVGKDILRAYDSAMEKITESEENIAKSIIVIGEKKYFEIHWLCGIIPFKMVIEYRPTEEEIKFLGKDYKKEIRRDPESIERCCVRDDAYG